MSNALLGFNFSHRESSMSHYHLLRRKVTTNFRAKLSRDVLSNKDICNQFLVEMETVVGCW